MSFALCLWLSPLSARLVYNPSGLLPHKTKRIEFETKDIRTTPFELSGNYISTYRVRWNVPFKISKLRNDWKHSYDFVARKFMFADCGCRRDRAQRRQRRLRLDAPPSQEEGAKGR